MTREKNIRFFVVAVFVVAGPSASTSMRPFASMSDGAMRPISAQGATTPAPVTTIIVPSADPEAASTTPEVVSGTTTGTVTGVTWATACVAGPTSCSTGAGTFSCSVAQTQDCAASQTVTIVATGPGGTGSDTTGLVFPALEVPFGSATPNDLPDALTINGVEMTIALACDGQGESGTTWTCRDSSGSVVLTEAGAGTSPTTTTLILPHAHDATERGVVFGVAQKRYDASAASVVDLTTEDMVVEWVGIPQASGQTFVDKGSLTVAGWRLGLNSSTSIRFFIRDASTSTTVSGPTQNPLSVLTHAIVFVDRSEASTNGALVYVGGLPGSGVDVSARAGSISNASTLTVGALGASTSTLHTTISLRIWKCAACMVGGAGNPTEWAPIARERTAIALGASPLLAAGIDGPTTMSRASAAFVDVVDGVTRAIYNVGHAGPRVARRGAGGVAVAGLLSEPQTTNLALQSQTLGTTFTSITVGDNVLADAFAGADLTSTGDDIDCATGTDIAECGLRQSITHTAVNHTLSVWAKAGQNTFAVLRNATIATGATWFDLTACANCNQLDGNCSAAVKTQQAGVSNARAIPYHVDTTGDGVADLELCRISITYLGTVAAHNIDIMAADADNDLLITEVADATANIGFWGVEVEAFSTETSYQATTLSSITRSPDDVRYDGASHYSGSPTTIDTSVLCPAFDVVSDSTFISVGTSTTNYGRIGILAASDRPHTDGANAGGQWDFNGSIGDVADGAVHSLRSTLVTNDVEGFYDGASFGSDVSNVLPTSASSFIYLGTRGSTAQQSNCLITRLRIWPRDVSIAEAP